MRDDGRLNPTRSPAQPGVNATIAASGKPASPVPHGISFGEATRTWARIAALLLTAVVIAALFGVKFGTFAILSLCAGAGLLLSLTGAMA